MRSVALAKVKAELSSYVEDAFVRGKATLITRHGKPVAAVVPAAMVMSRPRAHVGVSKEHVQAIEEEIRRTSDPNVSAVEDLIRSRR